MNRWWIAGLAVALAWQAPAATAQQFPLGGYTPPQVQQRPPFSPYLNLNRGGTQPGINYFGLVRPQLQTAQQLQNLQMQQGALANELGGGGGLGAPGQVVAATTGHPVYFFDYARFFPPQGIPNFGVFGPYGGPGFGPGRAGLGGAPGTLPGGLGVQPGGPNQGSNFGLIIR
jgi:hypothetical protein